jgi:hypothetical protein
MTRAERVARGNVDERLLANFPKEPTGRTAEIRRTTAREFGTQAVGETAID